MDLTQRPILWPVTFIILLAGCTLLNDQAERLSAVGGDEASAEPGQRKQTARSKLLRPLGPSGAAVQVEIVFVERAVSDPLLGKYLWQEVDQIGALEPSSRTTLQENGFRVGVAASTPPQALQALLDLKANAPEDAGQLVGRRVAIRSGGETNIQASRLYSQCSVPVRTVDDVRNQDYENARCVFRVKLNRLQDGWARLEFLPEIHHGRRRRRREATQTGWQFQTTQEIEPLYSQRFKLKLNRGEMVVLTADRNQPDSLGWRFFVGPNADARTQRLLVIRLADIAGFDRVAAGDN